MAFSALHCVKLGGVIITRIAGLGFVLSNYRLFRHFVNADHFDSRAYKYIEYQTESFSLDT
jgi:hypothetical protein